MFYGAQVWLAQGAQAAAPSPLGHQFQRADTSVTKEKLPVGGKEGCPLSLGTVVGAAVQKTTLHPSGPHRPQLPKLLLCAPFIFAKENTPLGQRF